MAHIVQFPRMNPLKFVPLDDPSNPLYNFRHDDKNWFQDSIQNWQRKVAYNQQWQLNDLLSLQVHATPGAQILEIIDCSQSVIADFTPQATIVMPGNTYLGEQLNTYQFQFTPDDEAIPEGKYWALLTVTFPDTVVQRYISEPLELKDVWPNSMLIQYSNSTNEYDTVFSLNPRFSFRLEATLLNPRPNYVDVGFDDQQRNTVLLNSETQYQYDFVVGFKQAVAEEWVIKHIAEAFRCSRVLLDGKQFVKPENEQWEIENRSPTPKATATLVVQEQNKWQNFTFGDANFTVYVSPLAYPYYVDPIFLSDGGAPVQVSDAREVLDATDEADFIDELNATATTLGMTGEFSISGALVAYQNGDGEAFNTATTVVREKMMEYTVVASVSDAFNYFVRGTHGRVYGDGVVATYDWTGPGTEMVNKVYTAGGTYTFRIYHNDDVTLLSFPAIFGDVEITTADSLLPVGMTNYQIVGHGLTSFGLLNLVPAQATLQSLNLSQNAIASLAGNPFGAQPYPSFASLALIDVSDNEISTTDIDNLFNNMWNDMSYQNGGAIDTSDQTPAAPPTGASAVARIDLDLAGWTIVTD